MPYASRSAKRGLCATKPSMLRSASPRGDQGYSGPVDRNLRGRQILATRHETGASMTFSSPWSTDKGFPDAINVVFPHKIVQTCVVHLIRSSMDFASWKDRRAIAAELKKIYGRKRPTPAKRCSMNMMLRLGAENTRNRPELEAQLGACPPFPRSPRPCGGSFTRPTPLNP